MRPDADVPLRPGDWLWISVALGVYLPIALASAAWIAWVGGLDELFARALGSAPLWGVAIGLVVGLFFVGLSRLASRTGWWRRLEDALSEHIHGIVQRNYEGLEAQLQGKVVPYVPSGKVAS